LEPRIALAAAGLAAAVSHANAFSVPFIAGFAAADSAAGLAGARSDLVPASAALRDTAPRLLAGAIPAAPVYGQSGEASLVIETTVAIAWQPGGAGGLATASLYPSLSAAVHGFSGDDPALSFPSDSFYAMALSPNAPTVGGGEFFVTLGKRGDSGDLSPIPAPVGRSLSLFLPSGVNDPDEYRIDTGASHFLSPPAGSLPPALEANGFAFVVSAGGNGEPVNVVMAPSVAPQQARSVPLGIAGVAASKDASQDAKPSVASSDNLPKANSPAATARSQTAENSAEGGFVDIGSVSRSSSGPAVGDNGPLTSNPGQPTEEPLAPEVAPALADDGSDLLDDVDAVGDKDQQTSTLATEEGLAGGVAQQDSARALASDEGGMVELAAAAFQPANSTEVSPALAASPEAAPSPDGHSIRVDKVMAQFQAFDLAGGPVERPEAAGLPVVAPHAEGAQAEAAGPAPADGAPKTPAADGGKSDKQIGHSAAALPAIAVAALLTHKNKSRGRRWAQSAAGLLRALMRRAGSSA
jgi:hypothetical protein